MGVRCRKLHISLFPRSIFPTKYFYLLTMLSRQIPSLFFRFFLCHPIVYVCTQMCIGKVWQWCVYCEISHPLLGFSSAAAFTTFCCAPDFSLLHFATTFDPPTPTAVAGPFVKHPPLQHPATPKTHSLLPFIAFPCCFRTVGLA